MAPTSLNPGDIAIVGYITNGSPDSFSFVNLVAIGSGTILYFTDNGWTGSAFRGVSATDTDGNENLIRFTANADLPAGTVIRSTDTSANFSWTTSGVVASGVAGSYAPLSLSQTGEQIAAVQSTNSTNPLFSGFTPVYQIDNTGAFENATTASEGNVATGLSQAGNTAVLFNSAATYAAFNLSTLANGTREEWLAAINNSANWTFGSLTTLPNTAIAVGSIPPGQPDLAIRQTDSPDPIVVNTPLTYILTVNNSGTANASGVTVDYTLPAGVTLNNTTVSNGFTASQTGNVITFSGGSITAGNNAVLTISVTPTATGILTSGTAIVDPLNTIAESDEANNTAGAIETTVNLPSSSNTVPTIGAIAPLSGVISDPTNPTVSVTVNDAETSVDSLIVTATATTNAGVVALNNVAIAGTGNTRTIQIIPTGVGYSDITITVTDGDGATASTVLNYAASAAAVTPTTSRFFTGTSDASTAVAIDANYMVVADDEDQVIRLYDRDESSAPIASFDFTSALGLTQLSGGIPREVDIEASTRVGNRIYWLGSHSNASGGASRPNRSRLFATDITGTGASTTLTYAGRYDTLRSELIAWGDANGYNFSASAAIGNIPEDPELDGFNIEGLTIAPDGTTAYIAFRAPNVPTVNRTKALIAPVSNFADLVTGAATSAVIGAPIELDLGGRGIREIGRNGTNQYVIIAGPADSATGTAPKDFRLYTWTGNVADAPVLRSADLTALNTGGSFESIVDVPNNLTNSSQIQLLTDNGDTIWYNDGQISKDLSPIHFQKFRSDLVAIGSPNYRIRDIQGASHISPLLSSATARVGVTNIPGIVVAKASNGFYLQDPAPDSNAATSEGIFVFTGTSTAGLAILNSVTVGSAVLVSGTVNEFRPGGSATNLTTTQISNDSAIQLLSVTPWTTAPTTTINPIVIGRDRTPPTAIINNDFSATQGNVETGGDFDPTTEGIDFYESLEGMLVQVNNPVSLSPTNDFGEIWVLADNGAGATGRTDRGGIAISPGDFNPERIQIDDDLIRPGASSPTVNVGAQLGTITGVISYAFSNYELLTTAPIAVTTPSPIQREVTPLTKDADRLTVAAFNVENLDPIVEDINRVSGTTQAQRQSNVDDDLGTGKFAAIADRIVNNLQAPDILSLEEIQDNNGAELSSVVEANVTAQTLIDAIVAAGGPRYEYRDVPPVNNQDGGQPGGNIRVGFLFNPDRVTFVSVARIDPTNPAFNSSRKPLAGQFLFNGNLVTVIGNHFNSKGGDQPLFGPAQPPLLTTEAQRIQQAQVVNNYVDGLLATDPNANVIVLGDLNDFQFSEPLNVVRGVPGGVGTPVLIDLADAVFSDQEQYTYNFQGNAQALDHILASNNLASRAEVDILHINSEFADQVSDHDPIVARFHLPTPNRAPSDVQLTPANVDENVADGSVVGLLSTTDLDTADRFVYTFVSGVGDTDNSAFAIVADQLLINESPDFEAKSSYSVRVRTTDLAGTPFEKVLTININNLNEAPIAVADSYTTTEETALTIAAPGVLANDRDVDAGTTLLISDFSPAANGTVSLNADGSLNYTPNLNFVGTDRFAYTITDGSLTSTASVNITVNPFINQIWGTSDDDRLIGTIRRDLIRGLGDDDLIRGLENDDLLYGDAGDDRIFGNEGNDSLYGGNGNDKLYGDSGNDFIWGEAGEDLIEGRDGDDTLHGGEGNDRITGGSGNDNLKGGLGNDTLLGASGNDILVGGSGSDRLAGGSGADQFVYSSWGDRGDTITDFNRNEDVLVLTDLFDDLNYGGSNPIADGYLRLVRSGSNTLVQIDLNGSAGGSSFSTLVTINGVTPGSLAIGTTIAV